MHKLTDCTMNFNNKWISCLEQLLHYKIRSLKSEARQKSLLLANNLKNNQKDALGI